PEALSPTPRPLRTLGALLPRAPEPLVGHPAPQGRERRLHAVLLRQLLVRERGSEVRVVVPHQLERVCALISRQLAVRLLPALLGDEPGRAFEAVPGEEPFGLPQA